MNLLQGEKSQSLSVLKDPFNKKSVTRVSVNYSAGCGRGGYWWGLVEFKNGNTEGTQKFEIKNPDGFQAIVTQIDEFMKSL